VLDRLLEGGWDILHYAGHGDFLPNEPNRAGWIFQDGLLTARELERMDTAPRLVVSNACLSSLTSSVGAAGSVVGGSDAQLVATLADEFFRRGVRDYIGTAWEVNDEGAILFAESLYDALLGGEGGAIRLGQPCCTRGARWPPSRTSSARCGRRTSTTVIRRHRSST
jgi:CHAT domain-containing protein